MGEALPICRCGLEFGLSRLCARGDVFPQLALSKPAHLSQLLAAPVMPDMKSVYSLQIFAPMYLGQQDKTNVLSRI